MIEFPKGVGQENLEYFRENPLDHIGLVCEIAKKYMNRGFDFDDLLQYGITGLLKACQRFEKERGNKISTYARWWIREEIKRALRTDLSLITVPEYLYSRSSKVERGELELSQESQQYLEAARKVWEASFLGISHDDEGYKLCCDESLIPNYPEQNLPEYEEDYTFLRKALTKLTVREQRVIIMTYFQGMTLNRIGKVMGLSKDTIRHARNQALQKLRESLGAVEA